MSKFKMICLDIDGTLLNSKHEVTVETKKAIRAVVNEKGIPVILVSGRMPKGIVFLQKELEIEAPIICYSGALVLDKSEGVLFQKHVSVSDIKEAYVVAKKLGVHVSLYKDDEWYIEKMDEWAKQEYEITNITPNITNFQFLLEQWEKEGSGANKILCMLEPDRMNLLKESIKIDGAIYPSKPTYLEIMPKGASKTSAIEVLREKFNINQREILAAGDNYNDVDMIEYAGLGVAMGNAPDEVKRCADFVTLSNDEDGVAEVIKKFCLDN